MEEQLVLLVPSVLFWSLGAISVIFIIAILILFGLCCVCTNVCECSQHQNPLEKARMSVWVFWH